MATDEERRARLIEGQLSVALELMEPAWSGLMDHPDRDELDAEIGDLRMAIVKARRMAYFLRHRFSQVEEVEGE